MIRVMPPALAGATVMRLLGPMVIRWAPLNRAARPPLAVVTVLPVGRVWLASAEVGSRPGAATRTIPLTSTRRQSAADAELKPNVTTDAQTAAIEIRVASIKNPLERRL